ARIVPTPPAPDGSAAGFVGAVLDVTDRKEVEFARASLLVEANAANARLRQLQDLTSRLARLDSLREVAELIVHVGLKELSGGAVALMVLSEDSSELEIVASAGYEPSTIESWRRFPVDSPTPAGDALRTGQAIFTDGVAETIARYPQFARAKIANEGAVAVLPLVCDSQPLGVLSLGFGSERGGFGSSERGFLEVLASQAAIALARTEDRRLLEVARAEAERRGAQLQFLARATAELAASLDLDATLDKIGELAVPMLADRCSIHLVTDGHLGTLVLRPQNIEGAIQELLERFPVGERREGPVRRAIDSGEVTFIGEVSRETLDASGMSDERRAVLERVGFGGVLVLPLRARGRIVGAVAFTNESGHAMSDRARELAEELAARAATAIDNALLFLRESQIARRLQASLLPSRLPQIRGLDLAARYSPATEDLEVGGDFYDCIELADERVLVVVGDVKGKGVEAAAATGLARHTIRSAALYDPSPCSVLTHLNNVLLDQDILAAASLPMKDGVSRSSLGEQAATDDSWSFEPRFCTAVVALLERDEEDSWIAEVCCGGHPLPLLREPAGNVHPIGRPGSLIGIDRSLHLAPEKVTLEAGSELVMFTDGISESHRGSTFFGEEGVAATLSAATGTSRDIAWRIEAAARDFLADEQAKDDMVVLVVSVPQDHSPAAQ
ncbi:MAG: GAF domain-containing SpoIIE family protein phosphatase, partial [Acidimicrobiales bacterium]